MVLPRTYQGVYGDGELPLRTRTEYSFLCLAEGKEDVLAGLKKGGMGSMFSDRPPPQN